MVQDNTVVGKYVFLDIVGYSYRRTIEAQSDVIEAMNKSVKESLRYFRVKEKDRILIPTGDGVCIALLDLNDPFDIHVRISLKILELVDRYNKSQKDEMRKFKVRIGINENTDNLIIDVNGNKNVAGTGITEAQRVMDQGEGGNILVGRTVYNHLCQREKYTGRFKGFPMMIKHNQKLEVYQFIDSSISYLNSVELKSTRIFDTFKSKKKEWGSKISSVNTFLNKSQKSLFGKVKKKGKK